MSDFDPRSIQRFGHPGYAFDASTSTLRCTYALDELTFVEVMHFAPVDVDQVDPVALDAALRLLYLLAGVSYYKAAAPPVVDFGDHALTPAERALLEAHYRDGLGEYEYVNGLDLSGVVFEAATRAPVDWDRPDAAPARPLIPFGGGIDSIVTVDGVTARSSDAALFVVSRAEDRFDAIEGAAAVTGLPVVRAERLLDDKILRSRELGYRNGHVPVTAIISAMAVVSAIIDGRDSVVMSNEHSASDATLTVDGRDINHQWSKSLAFEDLFRAALEQAVPTRVDYHSWLRPFSELWVSQRFAELTQFHATFRSCNRAFHIDRALRLDHWCGQCDKCCFVDLILSPYMSRDELREVFDGKEPLDDAALMPRFRSLLGTSEDDKPFECVGDVDESRMALAMAAERPDRSHAPVLADLLQEVHPRPSAVDHVRLLQPLGPHRIPDAHAPPDLLG